MADGIVILRPIGIEESLNRWMSVIPEGIAHPFGFRNDEVYVIQNLGRLVEIIENDSGVQIVTHN
jgi:hypothetical protein